MRPLVYGTACSGIGAPERAWTELGWRCAFASEIDAFPRAVYRHHHPEVPLHGDFTTIEAGSYEPIDLLVAGTPCQAFSVAGLRRGLADDRGNLALEYILLADRLRPRWLVWENVPGVFSSRPGDPPEDDADDADGAGSVLGHNGGPELDEAERLPKGSDFQAFLSGLVRWEVPIPEGGWRNAGVIAPAPVDGAYGVAWGVLDAQYFGVPQRRRRVFVVGHLGDWRRPLAVLADLQSLSRNAPPRRAPRQGATFATAPSLTGSGRGVQRAGESRGQDPLVAVEAFGGNNTQGPIEIATAVNAHGGPHGRLDFESETFVVPQVADPVVVKEGETYTHEGRGNFRLRNVVPTPFDTTQLTHPENRSNPQPGDPSPTLSKEGHAPAVVYSIMPMNSGKDYKAREVEVAQPVMTAPVAGNQGGDCVVEPGYIHPRQLRNSQSSNQVGIKPEAHVADALTSEGPGAVMCATGEITHALKADGFDASEDGTGRGQPIIAFTAKDSGGDAAEELAPTLRSGAFDGSHANGGVMPAVAMEAREEPYVLMERGRAGEQNLEYRQDGTANALLTPNGGRGGLGVGAIAHAPPAASVGFAVRRLTPRECERLQGFPDDFTAIAWRGKAAADCPDGPRYKALGNSMAVPVMRWIGERIDLVDRITGARE